MNDKPIDYTEALKLIKKLRKFSSIDLLNKKILELSIFLGLSLQKLDKLGLIQEFYDENEFPTIHREICDGLKKLIEKKS